MFGPAHLFALAMTLAAPLLLAVLVRLRPALDRPARLALAALLAGGWVAWYLLFAWRGWLTPANALPLNLCDWAAAVLIAALATGNHRAYVLGYFWGLCGTVQGLVTPDIAYGFPDPQFVFFFVNHGGIVAALLFLTLRGQRPRPRDLPFVVAATLFYALVAAAMDYSWGVDYGFLRSKPVNASIMQFLAPWPWYIPELVLIGLLSMAIYYAPFGLADLWRTYSTRLRRAPSRTISDSAPSS